MGFDKVFFENITTHFDDYFKQFPSGFVSFTIKLAYEREVNVYRILKCEEHLLTFAYYDQKKEVEIPQPTTPANDQQQGRREMTAMPAMTVPYSGISWVEINPGNAPEARRESGFKYRR